MVRVESPQHVQQQDLSRPERVITKLFNQGANEHRRNAKILAHKADDLRGEYSEFTTREDFHDQTTAFRERISDGESLNDLLPEAFAVAREAAKQVLGTEPYLVQLMGAAAIHRGGIAEMQTGEGKTLTATLAAYLNALTVDETGRGNVHIATANEFLAQRDAGWMGPLFDHLGLTVASVIDHQAFIYDPEYTNTEVTDHYFTHLRPVDRKEAYAADIVYAEPAALGHDYLRDMIALKKEDQVQRNVTKAFAIVDEADAVLIDEARTPLIITNPVDEEETKWYVECARLVREIGKRQQQEKEQKEEEDPYYVYGTDECGREIIYLTDKGIDFVEDQFGIVGSIYESENSKLVGYLQNALDAEYLWKRGKNYTVENNEVTIINGLTGRQMPKRRYKDHLHQALEAKEGVSIKPEDEMAATISIQNYFRLYDRLSGMTGSAITDADEFNKVYKLRVVPIPTNRESVRVDHPDVIYKTAKEKFDGLVDDIVARNLKEVFIPGADGTEEKFVGQPVLVVARDKEEVDYISHLLEERGFAKEQIGKVDAEMSQELEIETFLQAGRPGAITIASIRAGRGIDILLGGDATSYPAYAVQRIFTEEGLTREDDPEQYDEYVEAWTAHMKEGREADAARALGGLVVLGTRRHDSRRMDKQVRGRSGRQGDPGETQTYLSLDDPDLHRSAGRGLKALLKALNLKPVPEGTPIESKLASRLITGSQINREAENHESRKNVLKYDDVLEKQRGIIYGGRQEILESGDMELAVYAHRLIADVADSYVAQIITDRFEDSEVEALADKLHQIDPRGSVNAADEMINNPWSTILYNAITVVDNTDPDIIRENLRETIKEELYDGFALQMQKLESGGTDMTQFVRETVLTTLDSKWMEHLYELDYLRDGIHLRSIGQRDPLVEYQREAYDMYQEMFTDFQEEVVAKLFNPQVPGQSRVQNLQGSMLAELRSAVARKLSQGE